MKSSNSSPGIRQLNDRFRQQVQWPEIPGAVIFSRRIHALPEAQRLLVVEGLRDFGFPDYEPEDSDHRSGRFDVPGVGTVEWFILYYEPLTLSQSQDPADVTVTVRLLSVRMAGES